MDPPPWRSREMDWIDEMDLRPKGAETDDTRVFFLLLFIYDSFIRTRYKK